MEIVAYGLLGVNVVWAGYAIWANHRLSGDLRRAMEMLAARSYGEYAAGKAKLDGKTPDPTAFDPQFS
jgi:hypothetical protein